MTEPDRKRELKAEFKAAERRKLQESLPMEVDTLKELLSYLGREGAPPCDHTLKETVEFLQGRGIDPRNVLPWLHNYGGYCDCEVVFNVYDAVGDIVGWHLDP